jgi:EAL domain-containing protein (putative c-di-GMP-specific phosphodiesterase class I)
VAARCNEGQGYLFSRPVPASDVAGVIDRLNRKQTAASAIGPLA